MNRDQYISDAGGRSGGTGPLALLNLGAVLRFSEPLPMPLQRTCRPEGAGTPTMSVMAMLHQLTFQFDNQTSEGIYVINIYAINKCEL